MNNCITLKAAIEGVLSCQKENGHPESYLIDLRRTYNRLLAHAENLGTEYLTDELVDFFLSDSNSSRSGEFCHVRFLAHNRCIRFLKSFLETGTVSINKYHEPVPEMISGGLAQALSLYDQKEEASGLSQASLIKNRRPIRYLLEYMTSLGYENLDDIQPGDTIAAVEDMLEKHYDPTSLVTAISGMRRFYEMFPELKQYRLEIPSRMPRKRSIIDVYSEEEQGKIATMLSSPDISRRDAAICYGNAMVDYLLKERPACSEEYFFLSVKAPYVKLNTTWHIVRAAVSSAGVETTGRLVGTRMFRHNAASTMLRKGVPLPAISEELGHKSPDSTMVYLSTDQETMSSLTLPLPKEGDKD